MIIYIIENYSSSGETSGIARYNNYLFYCIKNSGFSVRFITSFYKPEILNDQEVYFLSKNKISNLKFWLKLFVFAFKIKDETHIFHFHHPYMIIPFYFAGKHKNAVITLHNDQAYVFGLKHNSVVSFFYRILWEKSLKLYSYIIADNNKLLERISEVIKRGNCRTDVLSVPVNTQNFYPLDKIKLREERGVSIERKVLLFAGRFVFDKNPLMALEVFQKVQKYFPESSLWMLGSGNYEKNIRKYMSDFQLAGVVLLGNVSQDTIKEYYSMADVLLVTSYEEGGPLVVKEALSCNLPVVSTDVGDVREVLAGLEGCYIATHNVEDFTEKVIRVLNDSSAKNYRKSVEKYNLKSFSEKIIKIYKSISEEVLI